MLEIDIYTLIWNAQLNIHASKEINNQTCLLLKT